MLSIPNGEGITDPDTRVDRLAEKAMDYLGQITSVNNRHPSRTLPRIRREYLQVLSQLFTRNF